MTSRRAALLNLAVGGTAWAAAPAFPASPASGAASGTGALSAVSVADFGALADGSLDATDAFNAAIGAASQWSEGMGRAIHVPPGRYRIDGTIRLRKGQHLSGAGEATVLDASRARGATITLGRDAQDRPDPGGAPVGLSNLRILGGNGSAPAIRVTAEGFSLTNLFLSAAGTGIEINGKDGFIAGITIDQALRGLVFRDAQNVVVQGVVTYLANYGLTLESTCSDIVVAQAVIAYSRNASILFAEGARGIRSVRFAECNFLCNENYDSFLGHVHVRSDRCDAHFANCTFRNWPGFAVRQQAGSGAQLDFSGCIFDGSRSSDEYNASASAGGVLTGAGARIHLSDCHFRNLRQEAVRIGPYLERLAITGGSIHDSAGHSVVSAADASGEWAVRAVDGFGRRGEDGSLILPWRGAATRWKVTARTTRGDGGITSAECAVVRSGNRQVVLLQTTSAMGASLDLSAGFGEAPNGPAALAGAETGFICLFTNRRDIVWSAETG